MKEFIYPTKSIEVHTMTDIKYWKDIDVLNIEFEKGDFEFSEEVADGVILDISKDGDIRAIEILDATKKMDKPLAQRLVEKYSVAKV